MKKLVLTFSIIIVSLTSMTVIVDLYTKEKIDNYINEIYTFTYGIGDLNTMLTLHKYNVGYGGDGVINGSTTGFRNLVLENTNLLYKTLDVYGEYMIRQINSRFSYKCKNCKKDLELEKKEDPRNNPNINDPMNRLKMDHDWKFRDNAWCKDPDIINQTNQSFKRVEFWKRMINKIDGYIQLADNLLSLPDNDLNYYILSNSVDWNSSSVTYESALSQTFEFNEYLKNQNFSGVDNNEVSTSLDHSSFPGDAIMLITRVYNYDKSWNPRRSLIELKKFSLLMKNKIIEVNKIN